MRAGTRRCKLQHSLGLRDLLIEAGDFALLGLELFLVADQRFECIDRLGTRLAQFVQLLVHHGSPNSGPPQASPCKQVSDFRSVSAQLREASRSRRTRRARISACGTSSEACSGSSSLPSPSASRIVRLVVLLDHAHHMVAGGHAVIVRGAQPPLVLGGEHTAAPRRLAASQSGQTRRRTRRATARRWRTAC